MAIHNLSSRPLSYNERKVLGFGLKFIPRPPPMAADQIKDEFRALGRKLRLSAFFGPECDTPAPAAGSLLPFSGVFPFSFKSSNALWNPPKHNFELDGILRKGEQILLRQIQSSTFETRPLLPARLLKALKTLRRDPSIIIKPADKNLGMVILDVSWYKGEGLRQLSDSAVYSSVSVIPWGRMHKLLSDIIKDFSFFLKKIAKFLLQIPISKASPCAFYLLPKIHKPTLVGRPICSYTGYFLEPASKLLHYLLLPVLLSQNNHLKDSLSLLRELQTLSLPRDCLLFTFDVESLYPSIPTDAGLHALKSMVTAYFAVHNLDIRLINLIMRLAELVLHYHFLEFDGCSFQQIRGTAMGSNFAVVYACLFLCHLEERLVSVVDISPLFFFKRFIDDAFGVWSGSLESLHEYFAAYQSIFPEIKITPYVSGSSAVLLDITFFKGPNFCSTGILSTQCFQKKLNAYQYIPYTSWHPHHQKKAFVISELQRYLIRESDPSGFVRLKKLLFQRLRARGYPRKFLLHCFNKVVPKDKSALLHNIFAPKIRKRTPLVFKLDFSHSTKAMNLGATLNPTLHRLCQEVPALRHIPAPRICWRNPRRLGSFLIRSRFLS